MSLERKLSEIEARAQEALRNNDAEKGMDLLAADVPPLIESLRLAMLYRPPLRCRQRIADALGIEGDAF